jgi:hypothetical protein
MEHVGIKRDRPEETMTTPVLQRHQILERLLSAGLALGLPLSFAVHTYDFFYDLPYYLEIPVITTWPHIMMALVWSIFSFLIGQHAVIAALEWLDRQLDSKS